MSTDLEGVWHVRSSCGFFLGVFSGFFSGTIIGSARRVRVSEFRVRVSILEEYGVSEIFFSLSQPKAGGFERVRIGDGVGRIGGV